MVRVLADPFDQDHLGLHMMADSQEVSCGKPRVMDLQPTEERIHIRRGLSVTEDSGMENAEIIEA
jgi:hypothetical protein